MKKSVQTARSARCGRVAESAAGPSAVASGLRRKLRDFLEFLLGRHDTVENAASQLLSDRVLPTNQKPVKLVFCLHENATVDVAG
ncbi:hypothetical protein I5R65_14485 [Herbaspirillum sp. AP02]|uniref:hypothetical protein n=1 Tax=unclassified Herbaspirillum TaxID=2624150 RepID=UPI0015DB4CFA|nr:MULTISPECIES: hypothetical protein [unclassified Herbaspirillum]MBG7620673.1 hypothetical protein [Herbaspirillum sp. AP02]NZD68137.1 hypothetical protein [Herbaspirillum sp. AP21]